MDVVQPVFERILELQDAWTATASDEMRERARLVRDEGARAVRRLIENAPELAVEASAGVGSNARVPWIRIFSPRRAPAPTVGWYVVYLFAADGSGVYLSLNQGTTNPGFGGKPPAELAARVEWAVSLLGPSLASLSRTMNLADRGLGTAYERGNVAARRYPRHAVPGDERLAQDLNEMLDLLRTVYDAEDSATESTGERREPIADASPSVDDPQSFVQWMRRRYGPELVPSRRAAEDEARQLLDTFAGNMTRDQALRLGTLLNQGTWAGVPKNNRFSPAFAGHAMNILVAHLGRFNDWTQRLWRPKSQARLAEDVDRILKDPQALPGAGRSFPTALLYLRQPADFAIWLQLTHQGLAALTEFDEPRGRTGGWDRYLRYCDAVAAFIAEYGLAPQEVDAVLAEAGRSMRNAITENERATVLPVLGELTVSGSVVEKSLTLGELAAKTHVSVETVDEWVRLVRGRTRQALFAGPPGTGKTWVATQLAVYLAGSFERVAAAQFHPSFSYEDFIEGLRPLSNDGAMTYSVRPGSFKAFCDRAASALEETFVYVIDEINRADVGSVLGELMLLLEYRGRPLHLPYSQEPFAVPENVIVLATMNTADRSLSQLDFALRRRFHTITLPPSRDVLTSFLDDADDAGPALAMFDLVQQRVRDERVAPGHSYWMRDDVTAAALDLMWRYELRPYLAELWFDAPTDLAQLDLDVVALLGEEA